MGLKARGGRDSSPGVRLARIKQGELYTVPCLDPAPFIAIRNGKFTCSVGLGAIF